MLILTIPGRQAALRVRAWRKLRALGVAALRDGVYVLPHRAPLREALAEHAREISTAGGSAQLLVVKMADGTFSRLFDRREEYRVLAEEIGASELGLKKGRRPQVSRTVERLQREFEAIAGRDYFPGAVQKRARHALDDLRARVERLRTPDEPHARQGRLPQVNRAEYQGRTWITRERPWVDRLASAWLIRRFIDPRGRIQWLKKPPLKQGARVGFDFDGAAFSHVGDKITFEVLVASFALSADPALERIGAIVHYLDVGGVPVPESVSVEAALRGMRKRTAGDDQFLQQACLFFDDLYAGFDEETRGA